MSGGIMTTGNWMLDLKPLIKIWYGDAYKDMPPTYKQIFDTESVNDKYEMFATYAPLGAAQLMDEGGSVSYDTAKQLFSKNVQILQYGLGFQVTQVLIEDAKALKYAQRRTVELKRSVNTTLDALAAAQLNGIADGTNYPGADGVAIFSTAHPTMDTNQSNILSVAADLDESSMEQILINMMKAKDNRGHYIEIKPKQLIVAPDNLFASVRLLMNPERPGTADRDISALNKLGFLNEKPLVWNRLTDTDQWIIQTDVPYGAMCLERIAPQFTDDKAFDSDNALFKVRFRVAFTMLDWRQFYGSPGA